MNNTASINEVEQQNTKKETQNIYATTTKCVASENREK